MPNKHQPAATPTKHLTYANIRTLSNRKKSGNHNLQTKSLTSSRTTITKIMKENTTPELTIPIKTNNQHRVPTHNYANQIQCKPRSNCNAFAKLRIQSQCLTKLLKSYKPKIHNHRGMITQAVNLTNRKL
eukprot:gene2964-1946_t